MVGPTAQVSLLLFLYIISGIPGAQSFVRMIGEWLIPIVSTLDSRRSRTLLNVKNNENTTIILGDPSRMPDDLISKSRYETSSEVPENENQSD